MIETVLDHLWQSTLFAIVAMSIIAGLRDNAARIRYWLWFSASVKFLIPFAFLAALGSFLPTAPHLSSPDLMAMRPAAQPFAMAAGPVFAGVAGHAPVLTVSASPRLDWTLVLFAIWCAGFLAVTARWLLRWAGLRRILRGAVDLPLAAPVTVKVAHSSLEPGLVGIWRPVILLPEGIAERLSPAELGAILAHEICHARRRDNLTAAIHMGVEALFWFYPLIWWLGGRLNIERERACDESVLASGTQPEIYVDSILKVCQFTVNSPLACVSGVSGANLKKRMEAIMENRIAVPLDVMKKILLGGSAGLVIAAPIVIGLFNAAPAIGETPGLEVGVPHPGTEAALRHQIEAWENQNPDTTNMGPLMVLATTLQRADIQKTINEWGALKSITFIGTGQDPIYAPPGSDAYFAEFENSGSVWAIAPLGPSGRIQGIWFGKAFRRDGTNRASPGTEAALRQIVEGLHAGKVPYGIMTPDMVKSLTASETSGMTVPQFRSGFGAAEDGETLVHFMVADANVLGAPRSFVFQRVDQRGLDAYQVNYEHGRVNWTVGPLTDGKVSYLIDIPSHFDAKPDPNTEASLRRYIASLESGHPDYGKLAPDLAAVEKMQSPQTLAGIKSLGPLKSIAFTGRGEWNTDIYDATFDYGKATFGLALNADGKVERYHWQVVR